MGILNEMTKTFALQAIQHCAGLPKRPEVQLVGKELVRSATSVGAHYRESTRSRSRLEFITKVEVALQELEQSRYWLELLGAMNAVPEADLKALQEESDHLLSVFIKSVKTAKSRSQDAPLSPS